MPGERGSVWVCVAWRSGAPAAKGKVPPLLMTEWRSRDRGELDAWSSSRVRSILTRAPRGRAKFSLVVFAGTSVGVEGC